MGGHRSAHHRLVGGMGGSRRHQCFLSARRARRVATSSVLWLALLVLLAHAAAAEVLLPVRSGDLYGFADITGHFVIAPQFENALRFTEDRAPVQVKGRWGYVDAKGTLVIKPAYAAAGPFSESLAVIQDVANGKFGYIDPAGGTKIPPQFQRAKRFAEGLAPIQIDDRWGFIDKSGKIAISPDFAGAEPFAGGLAPVKSGKWGYIDRTKTFVISPTFDDAKPFLEGYAPVRFGALPYAKSALVDKAGKIVQNFEYAWVGPFSEGLAPAQKRDAWGYIDLKGKEVIPPQFATAGLFVNGIAEVTDRVFGKVSYIDRSGTRRLLKSDRPAPGFVGPALVPVELKSIPAGATVYMIPTDDWKADPSLQRDAARLKLFRVPDGPTDVVTAAFERAYVILFELANKKDFLQLDVRKGKPNRALLTFP